MNYYEFIKQELINNEINRKVKNYSINRSDINTYYNVGKMLSEAGKRYGESIIKNYSKKLTTELGKKYTKSSLYNMLNFYFLVKDNQIFQTMSGKLSWSHYIELLKFNDLDIIKYYIKITEEQNLSVRELRNRIRSNEYERLDEKTKEKLKNEKNLEIQDLIKNPIVLNTNKEIIKEKVLQQLILENISLFLKQLGNGFSFIDNEYKIKIGDSYNYIDKNVRTIAQDKTIGIVITKKDNKFIMEYCSDERIFNTTYELLKV